MIVSNKDNNEYHHEYFKDQDQEGDSAFKKAATAGYKEPEGAHKDGA